MPQKGEYSSENPMKECAVCGNFYFRRGPSGALIAWPAWQKKRACGPSCAATYRWQQRHQAEVAP